MNYSGGIPNRDSLQSIPFSKYVLWWDCFRKQVLDLNDIVEYESWLMD